MVVAWLAQMVDKIKLGLLSCFNVKVYDVCHHWASIIAVVSGVSSDDAYHAWIAWRENQATFLSWT